MPDTQPDRASGGIPHTFRLRMAWQWVPKMPPQLRRHKAFLYALSTVAAMADTAGRTRWHGKDDEGPGRPLRLKELAAAMGSDEKDARRYLAAAIAAGLLTTEQAPQRGRTTVYVLVLAPAPRWAAALTVLTVGDETVVDDDAHATTERTENGGRTPVLDSPAGHASSGDASPNSAPVTGSQERGTPPRWRTGDASPLRTGDASPNKTRGIHDHHHEMVAVGPQVRDARGQEIHERVHDPSPPPGPPPLHAVPPPPSGTRARGRSPRMPEGQPPLLLPVPAATRPATRPAHAPAGDRPIGAPRDGWRAAVARERPEDTARVFSDRWTGDHARYLPDATGT